MFLLLCIPTRLYIANVAKTTSKNTLMYMGYLSLIVGLSFMYIYATGSRKTGLETQGDKIWWNALRPFHGLMHILFAYYAVQGNSRAHEFLLVDVFVGLVAFLWYHYSAGNFKKLVD
jgi:hypothetical protein